MSDGMCNEKKAGSAGFQACSLLFAPADAGRYIDKAAVWLGRERAGPKGGVAKKPKARAHLWPHHNAVASRQVHRVCASEQ